MLDCAIPVSLDASPAAVVARPALAAYLGRQDCCRLAG